MILLCANEGKIKNRAIYSVGIHSQFGSRWITGDIIVNTTRQKKTI